MLLLRLSQRMLLLGKALIFSLTFLVATTAQATPDAGLVLSDQIVGATARSFFVIRTSTLRPPSYYEYSKRVELVELSIETGGIESKCLVRETAYTTDPNAPSTSWVQNELMLPACHPFELLSQKGANYIEPKSVGTSYYKIKLGEDGLSFQKTETDDTGTWMPLLPLADVKTRALNGSKIKTASLPWYVGEDAPETINAVTIDDAYEPLYEACTPHQFPFNALRIEWQFIRLNCWSGDDDTWGASFYVPVPARLLGIE